MTTKSYFQSVLQRAQPAALRRYHQARVIVNPNNDPPQCWMAETEVGEAWRAMPIWLRVVLLWKWPIEAAHEVWAEIRVLR